MKNFLYTWEQVLQSLEMLSLLNSEERTKLLLLHDLMKLADYSVECHEVNGSLK